MREPFGCTRELLRGTDYIVGEILLAGTPGFGLWRIGAPFAVRAYPNQLDGWYAVVDDFHALGQMDKPMQPAQRTA